MKSLLSDAVSQYILDTWVHEPDVLRRLREETASMPEAGYQISPDQGVLMTLLVRAFGVRRALEVGVFTGYSSLCTALGLPADGKLVACDISDEFTQVARRYWADAGVADRVELLIGPATESLDTLIERGEVFDWAFIDADKPNYPTYWEQCLKLVRPGGVILVDNVLWSGRVADPSETDESTVRMREFNTLVRNDPRVDLAIIPIADGITIARVR